MPDVEKDEHEAFRYFTKAADKGNATAMGWVGEGHSHGKGTSQDAGKAVEDAGKKMQEGTRK